MKTIVLKVAGQPVGGDLAVIAYTTPRGGMSYAKYLVKGEQVRAELVNGEATKIVDPADSTSVIAARLAEAINDVKSEFCPGQFTARVVDDMVVISCADSVDNVTFIAQVQGSGSGTIEEM